MLKKVKVLVVDDSMFFRKVLIDNLSAHANIEVVGFAINAYDAKTKLKQLHPDVMTLDVEMPGMNGIEFLKQILPERPIPVILVSSLSLNLFEALSAGAVDFVRKPDAGNPLSLKQFFNTLTSKIIVASHAKVIRSDAPASASQPAPSSITLPASSKVSSAVIAIGASTGGTEAILAVLKQLPRDTPPIVITQHMPEGFTKMYSERLDRICAMEVREAKNGDALMRGLALIAPGGLQMKVVKNMQGNLTVNCAPGEKVNGHSPSVDVLFDSVATTIGRNAVGIILTGMGRDGADGLLRMRRSGAYTIGQDKETCVVYGMPMVAYDIGGVCAQSPLNNIPTVLRNYLSK